MKKIFLAFVLGSALVSCKKETASKNSNSNSSNSISTPGAGVTDVNGKLYKTVKIGNQEWMAENLDVTKYNDGTEIKKENGYRDMMAIASWLNLKYGVWCNQYNQTKYGKIYNGYVVESKKACPAGWHIPSKVEWETLINNLGGENEAGKKLKQTGYEFWHKSDWLSTTDTATNSSGFSAIPTGGISNGLNIATFDARFWTSDLTNVIIDNDFHSIIVSKIITDSDLKKDALTNAAAIRCLKD